MSYILDALKRSERERRGQAPITDPLLGGGAPAPAPSRPLWPVLLGLALLANAGVLAAYLLLREQAAPPPPHVAAPSPPPVRGAPAAQPPPPDAARQIREDTSPPRPEALPEPPPAAAPPAEPRPAKPPAAEPERQQASTPAVEADPRAASADPSAPWEALPYLEELPAGFRGSVPEVSVDVHVFTDDPSRRFVLMELRRYREGDQLPSGLRLLHITPDGIALAWQGRRFRLSTR